LAFIVIDEGESIESALRRFKRRVQQEAIIKEIRSIPCTSSPERESG